jgi:cell division septation protein DedD
MQAPESVGSSAARMIVAITLFVAAVGGGVWALGRLPKRRADDAKISISSNDLKQSRDKSFFYEAIGQAPAADKDAPAAAPLLAGKASPKTSYTLEIKVTTSREEAEQLIDTMHAMGVEAYYTPLARAGRVVYRVRRGIYTSAKDASQAALAIAAQGHVKARVVKLQ